MAGMHWEEGVKTTQSVVRLFTKTVKIWALSLYFLGPPSEEGSK